MTANVTTDWREWQKAAQSLLRQSTREVPHFLNGQALKVASEALKHTHHADPAKVEHQLGMVARELILKKRPRNGKLFRKGARIVKWNSLAHRILMKRFRLTGEWGIAGETLQEKAINLIAARTRSINFIRSGWIPAIRGLSMWLDRFASSRSAIRDPSQGRGGAKVYGQPKGGVRPATTGSIKASCEIINRALETFPKPPGKRSTSRPMAIAERGLAIAISISTKDMWEEWARRMGHIYEPLKPRG